MMKRYGWILAAALVLALCLTACSGGGEKDDPNLIKIDKYEALYKGYEIVKDSDDEDAIAIKFTFTNNDEETTSFMWAFFYDVMQDGIGLENAVVWVSDDSFDTLSDDLLTDVAKGKSLDVVMTYKLRDLTSDVELKFSDLFDKYTDELTIKLDK